MREATQRKKNQEREQLTKKLNHDQKIPTSKSNSHNNSISQITVGSMIKILAPWTLKPKVQIQITEKLFQHSFFIDYVD